MNTCFIQPPFRRNDDPVELGHRTPGRKAPSRRKHPPWGMKLAQRPAMQRPFVGIAHQDGWAGRAAPTDMGQDRAELLTAAQARKVQMHPHHAQPPSRRQQIDPDRTARLQRWQRHDPGLNDAKFTPDQQRVAMPADTIRPHGQRHRAVGRVLVNRIQRQHCFSSSKAPVGFLQCDYIGVDFAQDGKDPIRITAAIKPDRLVNIVAGKRQLHPAGQASPAI